MYLGSLQAFNMSACSLYSCTYHTTMNVRTDVPLQVTLGVFLVVAPFEVWVTWCALGLAWIATFFIHEVAFLVYKIYSRVKKNKIER